MRTDLDFLYQRAMRSSDWRFIDEIAGLLLDDDRGDDADLLFQRSGNIFSLEQGILESPDRFSFIVSDSQWGADWYRNR